jgi:hypothetical protein
MGQQLVRAALAATCLVSSVSVAGAQEAAPAVLLVEDAEPVLPAGGSPGFIPPAHDESGYVTPNRGLSPEEKTWHVRVALNVAALGCRRAGAEEIVGGYNAMLTAEKATLAATATAMGARYKARYGTAWQARHDDAMTKLYNFWALPPVQAKFCGAALGVLREAAAVEPAAFAVFAAAVLPRLEAPMLAYFEEFDRYRTAREAWRTRRARAMIAAALPAGPASAPAAMAAVGPSGTVPNATTAASPAANVLAAVAPVPLPLTAAAPAPVVIVIRAGAGEP